MQNCELQEFCAPEFLDFLDLLKKAAVSDSQVTQEHCDLSPEQ